MRMIEKRRPGRQVNYPWDEWTNGEIHIAKQGEDFNCRPMSFVALVHGNAKARNLKAETSTKGSQVTFRIYRHEETE